MASIFLTKFYSHTVLALVGNADPGVPYHRPCRRRCARLTSIILNFGADSADDEASIGNDSADTEAAFATEHQKHDSPRE
jgi:hypothetical protein